MSYELAADLRRMTELLVLCWREESMLMHKAAVWQCRSGRFGEESQGGFATVIGESYLKAQGSKYESALQAACKGRKKELVELLLE